MTKPHVNNFFTALQHTFQMTIRHFDTNTLENDLLTVRNNKGFYLKANMQDTVKVSVWKMDPTFVR